MDKKLPNVFANKIDKNLNNNKTVFVSSNERNVEPVDNKNNDVVNKNVYKKNISQKINDIFNSSRYVYKASVKIVTDKNTVVKNIIGRNGANLITIDNELIPIDEILDISFED